MSYNYIKPTDQAHTIKVDSCLISALWKSGSARGCGVALFEVRTSFVGEGSSIEILVKGREYGKITKIKDSIFANHYCGEASIPKKTKPGEDIWFQVKLPKLGINGTSNVIPAKPPIELRKMAWDKKEARRGDTLKIGAELEGTADDEEADVVIYEYDRDGNHDKIADLPTKIKNGKIDLSWEFEYHEDTDEIPTDKEMKKYGKSYNPPEYFFVVVVDGQRIGENQESGLLQFKDIVTITLHDVNRNPVPDQKYTLTLPDGSTRKGALDAKGKAEEKDVPPGAYTVEFPEYGS